MDKKIVFLVFVVALLPLISAVDKTGQQNEARNLTISCSTINCSDGDILLSLDSPSGEILLKDINMSKQGSYATLYITSGNFTEVGEYWVYMDTDNHNYFIIYEITPSGQKLTDGELNFNIALLVFVIAAWCVVIYWMFKLPWKHGRNEDNRVIAVNWKKIGKVALIYGGYLLTMWMFGILTSVASNYSSTIAFSVFFNYFYTILLALAIPLFFVSVIIAGVIWFQNQNLEKIARKIPLT